MRASNNLLSDIEYTNQAGATIKVIKGGFSVNFDQSGESIPRNDVQLTIALVLGAISQAANMLQRNEKDMLPLESYMLAPSIQKYIVKEWLTYYCR